MRRPKPPKAKRSKPVPWDRREAGIREALQHGFTKTLHLPEWIKCIALLEHLSKWPKSTAEEKEQARRLLAGVPWSPVLRMLVNAARADIVRNPYGARPIWTNLALHKAKSWKRPNQAQILAAVEKVGIEGVNDADVNEDAITRKIRRALKELHMQAKDGTPDEGGPGRPRKPRNR